MVAGLKAVLALMLAASPSAVADLEARAQAAFEAGRYSEVAALAAEAFKLTGNVRHLYAQAQAVRLSGDCQGAAVLYARVLSNTGEPSLTEHAREGIRLCEGELQEADAKAKPEAEPEAEPATVPPPRPEPETLAHAAPPDRPARWHRDPAGATLLAAGLAGVAVGMGLLFQARADARAAPSAADDVAHARLARRVTRFEAGSAVALGIGSSLIVGAVIRYIVVARRTNLGKGPMRKDR